MVAIGNPFTYRPDPLATKVRTALENERIHVVIIHSFRDAVVVIENKDQDLERSMSPE